MELHDALKDIDYTRGQCRSPHGVLTDETSQSKDCSKVDEDRVEGDFATSLASGTERRQGKASGTPFT